MDTPSQTASSSQTLRLVRPSVVVLCGPAGCGKSAFAAKHFRSTQVISSDQCRALVCDDEKDQRFQDPAFALLDFILDLRLELNRLCVVDSTAITQAARRSLLERARRHGVPCVAVLFDVPLEACLAHDRARPRTVGAGIVERQYQLFQQVKAGIREEGFDQVIVLHDEDLDHAQVEIAFRPIVDWAAAPGARHGRPFEHRTPRPKPRPHVPRPATSEALPHATTGPSGSSGKVVHPEPVSGSNGPGAVVNPAEAGIAPPPSSGGDGRS